MTRLKQNEWQPFQRSREQQTGQFSMQGMAVFGSDFGANQQLATTQIEKALEVSELPPNEYEAGLNYMTRR